MIFVKMDVPWYYNQAFSPRERPSRPVESITEVLPKRTKKLLTKHKSLDKIYKLSVDSRRTLRTEYC